MAYYHDIPTKEDGLIVDLSPYADALMDHQDISHMLKDEDER